MVDGRGNRRRMILYQRITVKNHHKITKRFCIATVFPEWGDGAVSLQLIGSELLAVVGGICNGIEIGGKEFGPQNTLFDTDYSREP